MSLERMMYGGPASEPAMAGPAAPEVAELLDRVARLERAVRASAAREDAFRKRLDKVERELRSPKRAPISPVREASTAEAS